ncbi:exonuclease domain-containing protein [Actinotignum urinale]|uniref:exonuclease domain-containing protein n=1 Tax=Actinotignum urinale TaxID=190146 RepID=UPI002A80CEB3|nr:exonuclease domain-containing protein [Actinotignum urinale]MDY5129029.1 exonuclease domain-containing protein [Actinotignum urinale]
MTDWTDSPVLGFDTETTGVDTTRDRIVTCSLILVQPDGSMTKKYWLINPGVPIPEQASRIHHITTDMVQAEGRPAPHALEEIASLLAEHMAQGFPAVAFNASYDFTLLEHDLFRNGLPTLKDRLGGQVSPVLDPYLIDRACDRYRRGKRRLENLTQHYGVNMDDAFHNAEADVLATLRILRAQIEAFPNISALSLPEVEALQRKADEEFQQFLVSVGRMSSVSSHWPVTEEPADKM